MGFIGDMFGGGHDPAPAPAPVYDETEEKEKAEKNTSEASKKKIRQRTDTVRTTALGAASPAQTARKTILGG